MLFQQVLNRDLGCASYILADAGQAIVVDPRWDLDIYREIAAREGVAITHVVDTHDHADHVSGRARLAALTGAAAHQPVHAGDAVEGDLAPGDELTVGSLLVRVIATPGHRPEHLALAVSDVSRATEPWLVLTGDSLLVGDLARPDLAVAPELGARQLRKSLIGLLELGDHVEVWPGHVGGSLCGGPGLSAKTSSTIGFERRHQTLLGCDEDAFIARLLANLPPRPPNLAHVVERNRSAVVGDPPAAGVIAPAQLRAAIAAGATVIDAREPAAYDRAHIAGAINLPATSSAIGTRAGWAVAVGEEIAVVAEELDVARAVADRLAAVGLSCQAGLAVADVEAWRRGGLELRSAQRWNVAALAAALRRRAVELIDVRDDREWQAGHVEGSRHLPLHQLGDGHLAQLPGGGRDVAVACAAGGRAAFAASLLRRAGVSRVCHVAGGGIGDLPAHGIELATGA